MLRALLQTVALIAVRTLVVLCRPCALLCMFKLACSSVNTPLRASVAAPSLADLRSRNRVSPPSGPRRIAMAGATDDPLVNVSIMPGGLQVVELRRHKALNAVNIGAQSLAGMIMLSLRLYAHWQCWASLLSLMAHSRHPLGCSGSASTLCAAQTSASRSLTRIDASRRHGPADSQRRDSHQQPQRSSDPINVRSRLLLRYVGVAHRPSSALATYGEVPSRAYTPCPGLLVPVSARTHHRALSVLIQSCATTRHCTRREQAATSRRFARPPSKRHSAAQRPVATRSATSSSPSTASRRRSPPSSGRPSPSATACGWGLAWASRGGFRCAWSRSAPCLPCQSAP